MPGRVEEFTRVVADELAKAPEVGAAIIEMVAIVSGIAEQQKQDGVIPNESTVFDGLNNNDSRGVVTALYFSLVMDNNPEAAVFKLKDLLESEKALANLAKPTQR